jgi:hypothetical protein
MKQLLTLAFVLLVSAAAAAQRGTGEIRVHVVDESGAPVAASGTLVGEATRIRRNFVTSDTGVAVLAALPTGVYELRVTRPGFALYAATVDVRSALPLEHTAILRLAPLAASVSVSASGEATLLDPTRTGSVRYVGADQLRERQGAAPGRSIIDLVNAQPGWLLEANGVLHARGSEYQVQYVIDGIPLRDNRSPAFAQSLGADEFESIAVRTGGYPAEFGGKLGGVIEVNTARDARTGVHGSASLQAGSFKSRAGFGSLQLGGQRLRGGFSAEKMATDRYLDPPTERNFTNHGAGSGVSGRLERAWSESNRTRAYGYRRTTRFEVPNEVLQEEAGQRQQRTARERLGQLGHQQVVSASVLLNAGVMARETGATLSSNDRSIPIRATQDRGFTELYANGSITAHRGVHEIKIGGEAIGASIRERFDSVITARRIGGVRVFDDDVPTVFGFVADRRLHEQAVYAQDVVHAGAATVSAGLRYDRYRLMVNEQAFSPRLSASWLVDRPRMVLHASYDRTFESQPIENIILASSDLVDALGGAGEARPLLASRGHFSEVGVSLSLGTRGRAEASYYLRRARNVTDDELLLNTAISFPIAFASAEVKGLELAFDLLRLGPLSGSIGYTVAHGVGRLPVAGGLFIGDEVADLFASQDEFDLSQDQRHTLRARIRSDIGQRAWFAAVMRYDSGLPVELEDGTDEARIVTQYGADIARRVNFERGRVTPSFALDLTTGVQLLGNGTRGLRVQADLFNVFDRLNVINVAGLLSGTAIAPGRSFAIRAVTEF